MAGKVSEVSDAPVEGKETFTMITLRLKPSVGHRVRAAAALEGKQVGAYCSDFLAEHANKTLENYGVNTNSIQ